ncbi:MAG TPA: Gfo/Idh/MocA family oxidoreductase [Microbacteriaceae bacterium]|nr:Gfo/Idh/MocA family oxidoreductase [Microbacteriaceae bacterium]
MTHNEPVRFGVIGAGFIAGVHGIAAQAIPETFSIVAAADASPAAAAAIVARFGWQSAYNSVAEMIQNESLDGVIISTWPSSHMELLEQCIASGVKYVLCEKPLVLTGEQALKIWDLASQAGCTVVEAFMYRHHPAIARIEEIVASGRLGKIDHVRASFTYLNKAMNGRIDPKDPNRPWRYRADQGGGALYDIGTYAINASTHFAGGVPTRVAAFGRARNEYGTNDKIIGLIDFDNDIVGMIESSEVSDSNQEVQISGELGTLHLPAAWNIYDETSITIRSVINSEHRDNERAFRTLQDVFSIPRSNAFQDQLVNVAKVVRGEAKPRVSLAETVINTITMEALARSLNERDEIDVVVPEQIATAFRAAISARA